MLHNESNKNKFGGKIVGLNLKTYCYKSGSIFVS